MRQRFGALALAVATVAAVAIPSFAASATPLPHVAGPLPVTATSHSFGAAAHERVPEDLAQVGYVEEEFLVSGTANVYDWPAPGPAVVRTANAPYSTVLSSGAPSASARFSGVVIVEMLNPSNLFDLDRHGNVTNGIRSPFVDVPTSRWFGNSTGASFCRIAGHEEPFDRAKLHALYPTPAAYTSEVENSVRQLVADRWLTAEDGADLVKEAHAFAAPLATR